MDLLLDLKTWMLNPGHEIQMLEEVKVFGAGLRFLEQVKGFVAGAL